MPNAARILIIAFGAATLTACGKGAAQNDAANGDMPIESNLAGGQIPANADIETLPPDESSETPSGELESGAASPQVNDLSNAH